MILNNINESELADILDRHQKWLNRDGGRRANLSGADLRNMDLSEVDLSFADLSFANLRGSSLRRAKLISANLGWANLEGADLTGAELYVAILRGASLRDAVLHGANMVSADLHGAEFNGADFAGANLEGTSFDDDIRKRLRKFSRQCPPLRTGGRIVYRTARSLHVGGTIYKPGRTYVAPVLSADPTAACHPGIYAGSLEWVRNVYPDARLVRCYVRDGDWFIAANGSIRCKRLRVLDYADNEGER